MSQWLTTCQRPHLYFCIFVFRRTETINYRSAGILDRRIQIEYNEMPFKRTLKMSPLISISPRGDRPAVL